MATGEMKHVGLMQVAPGLVDTLRCSAADVRQQMVERACLLAARRAGVSDPTLFQALDVIRRRCSGDAVLRGEVDLLAQELDDLAWGIQQSLEAGVVAESEYLRAFAKARAVAAIGFALDGSFASSCDSLYEAYHAIGDKDDFMRAVVTER